MNILVIDVKGAVLGNRLCLQLRKSILILS